MKGPAMCFTCGIKPAGHPTWPYSAYCLEHQPYALHPVIGGANQCAACDEHSQFGRLKDFDEHQSHFPKGHPEWGCFTGVCKDPATLDGEPLTQDSNGVWQTESGLAKRTTSANRLRAAREDAA